MTRASDDAPSTSIETVPNLLEPTIFHEAWWLTIASSGGCKFALVERGGEVIGQMPYQPAQRFGIRSITMPMLTPFLGPAIVRGNGSPNTEFLRKMSVTRELIGRLPPVSQIWMKLYAGITETVAFQEQGFRTSVQFTHEIEPAPAEELWANLRNKTRNMIRRAQEAMTVSGDLEAEKFLAFYAENLKARKKRNFLDLDVCRRLMCTAIQKDRGQIVAVTNSAGALQAANFYVWDSKALYFLMTTPRVDAANGAVNLLVWEGIKEAARRELVFDSDGLNDNGGILFFAGLGAVLKPRYIISKSNLVGDLLNYGLDLRWGKNFFVRG